MFRISASAVLFVALGLLPSSAQSKPPQEQENSAQANSPVRVPTALMLGRFERKVMPVYPDEAMLKGIQGDVWLDLEVDETGKIVNAQAMEGDPLLIAASKEALEKSRFHPCVVNGTPVRVESRLGFHFTLEKNGSSVNGRVDFCDHRWGFPCCCWSTLPACRRHYPGRSDGPRSLVLSHQRRPSRYHGGLAPALIVSRPARRSLTLRPACLPSPLSDPLHRRLRRFRFLHRRSDCFRVERTQFPGGTFTRSRPAPFHGARDIGI